MASKFGFFSPFVCRIQGIILGDVGSIKPVPIVSFFRSSELGTCKWGGWKTGTAEKKGYLAGFKDSIKAVLRDAIYLILSSNHPKIIQQIYNDGL